MKKFDFRLQKILQHRQILLERAKGDYLEALNKVHLKEDYIEELETNIMSSRETVLELCQTGQNQSSRLVSMEEFIIATKFLVKRAKLELRELKTELEALQEKMIEASRDHKALELMKDRKREEHRKEVIKDEQKKVDDIFLMRRNRKA